MTYDRLSTSIRYTYHCIFLLTAFILSACAPNQVKESAWSAELPPRNYFLNSYEQDDTNKKKQSQGEYLTWVIRFYEGWELYPRGWNKITQELLMKIKNPQIAQLIKTKMNRAGLLISSEWAKDNHCRTISTRHVALWGNALMKSVDRGESLQLIDRVTADVQGLLARKISADAISADRFYQSYEDDPL
jgi:hypothetical protein